MFRVRTDDVDFSSRTSRPRASALATWTPWSSSRFWPRHRPRPQQGAVGRPLAHPRALAVALRVGVGAGVDAAVAVARRRTPGSRAPGRRRRRGCPTARGPRRRTAGSSGSDERQRVTPRAAVPDDRPLHEQPLQHLERGPLAGADGAVHVAGPVRRGLRAGPVHPAVRPPDLASRTGSSCRGRSWRPGRRRSTAPGSSRARRTRSGAAPARRTSRRSPRARRPRRAARVCTP